ncbi:MAG: 4Fe-4S binding protein [Verrucomicrobia bacterium]|nr:4Fe-4S binding protein [Verrucomicrobiota bacterium]
MQPYGFVSTIKERCRVCYTCVRECPAKAIRIADGQAEVLPERCIGCGNCVRVCSQRAKRVPSATGEVNALLAGEERVAAIIAPSFPAEFPGLNHRRLVGMLRALGFDLVNEVAFGADLVAARYQRLLSEGDGERYIATSCPAIVAYVERYHPQLVPALAPIVSPMIATARALKRLHGPALRIVFIGPCLAKKGEAATDNLHGEVDAVLTFLEIRELFAEHQIDGDRVEPGEFDAPLPGLGALFPITRGLLQAAKISEDLMIGEVVAADGRKAFVEALREFAAGDLNARLLEVLCCNGCIMGAGMTCNTPLFTRRSQVSAYVRERFTHLDAAVWRYWMAHFESLDLSRQYTPNDQRIAMPSKAEIDEIMARMGKLKPEDELNCGACGYESCLEHAVAIYKGLAESEMCLPYTIEQLKSTVGELATSNDQLAKTQEALMHSERLASMGQLAAGIAHEVNNPLGIVLMYSHLLLEDVQLDDERRRDLKMIAEQADRCKRIVSGLLNFARQNKVVFERVDVPDLVNQVVHAITDKGVVTFRVEHAMRDPVVELDRDQIVQVLTNLINNATAAMPNGGTLTLSTSDDGDLVALKVADTGIGIPRENFRKLFQPFFTTKQMGKGTGLGLAVTYGIVKMHRGDITVESNADPAAGATGTTFTVKLPRRAEQNANHVAGSMPVNGDPVI